MCVNLVNVPVHMNLPQVYVYCVLEHVLRRVCMCVCSVSSPDDFVNLSSYYFSRGSSVVVGCAAHTDEFVT